jgi:DNA-binding NarL/FixJ family response regulator
MAFAVVPADAITQTGKSVSEIAEAFALSAKTISTHKMRLMQKLGFRNNAGLIRSAIRHGLVTQ